MHDGGFGSEHPTEGKIKKFLAQLEAKSLWDLVKKPILIQEVWSRLTVSYLKNFKRVVLLVVHRSSFQ
jgi:hypothetical protein